MLDNDSFQHYAIDRNQNNQHPFYLMIPEKFFQHLPDKLISMQEAYLLMYKHL